MIASRPLPAGLPPALPNPPSPPAMPRRSAPTERPAPAVAPTRPSRELQVFDNPAPQRDYVLRFDVPEFTCLCPLTGQPDFARFTIEVVPDRLCIELKSLKLYFWSFRDEGAFHEKVTNQIVDDLVRTIEPRFVRVDADWFVRGGIGTRITVEHRKKGWRSDAPVWLPPAAPSAGVGSPG
jgi:7-cyano-7-deazaguanine reductase